ncbi:Alt RNA polymerase ADP-ribosylase [Vibrio phage nt-1]|uniref:Alt RNA polymerase ADP-ribosylase n=1 Tax=Vibrio phage nt-1 TaxID=115992 RepID=R9TG90_9CAUD|nr:Alt RNA polymerase ADP-ribosylase [Vibrio phage nt-1]AGN30108.2 Alt RNA polymerase ADP-ribosylase [Vibrio phage nt-1]
MIGYQQLTENMSATYDYYPARSTKENKFFVIDMKGEARDIVVSFTTKTKSDIGNRGKRSWFCTVSAMRGKKGGLTIREMGDQQKLIETIVTLVYDFMLSRRANVVSMRIQKLGSGKMFDMRVKTLFKKLRYGCETTKIVNDGTSEMVDDFSYFVITKPGYNADKLFEASEETVNMIAAKMSQETDISSKKTIIVTAGAEYDDYDDVVLDTWVGDNPAARVPNAVLQMPQLESHHSTSHNARLTEIALTESESKIAMAAQGLIDMNLELPVLANSINSYMHESKNPSDVFNCLLESRSRALEAQYERLSMLLMQEDSFAGLGSLTQAAISRYSASRYAWKVNEALVHGIESDKASDIIKRLDYAFAEAGKSASAMTLYRGAEMSSKRVGAILESGVFASTAFISSSTNPIVACNFVESSSKTIVNAIDKNSKSTMLDMLETDKKLNVVFVIEAEGLPILATGKHGKKGDCEFIINRNTLFEAELIQLSEFDAVIRLKKKNKHEKFSVLSERKRQERIHELTEVADFMRAAEPTVDEERLVKERSPLTP